MYWPVGDDIRTANSTVVDKKNEAVIYGLQIDVIYKLRVMAFNRGGDGKKSPTVFFTILKGITELFFIFEKALTDLNCKTEIYFDEGVS